MGYGISNGLVVACKGLAANASTTLNTASTIGVWTFNAEPNASYQINCDIRQNCNNTGGIKYAVTVPGTSTLNILLFGNSSSATATTTDAISVSGTLSQAYNTFNGSSSLFMSGRITADSTGGVVSIQFASATAGQTSLVSTASSFTVTKMELT